MIGEQAVSRLRSSFTSKNKIRWREEISSEKQRCLYGYTFTKKRIRFAGILALQEKKKKRKKTLVKLNLFSIF